MNTRAYADLLQCCTQDIVSCGIVDTAKDKDLMNGNTALAWKRLSDKFAGWNNTKQRANYYRKENIETKSFTGNCNYCHKKGHRESECRTKQNNNANNAEE